MTKEELEFELMMESRDFLLKNLKDTNLIIKDTEKDLHESLCISHDDITLKSYDKK